VSRRNRLSVLMRRAQRGADELLSLAQVVLPSQSLEEVRELRWPLTSIDEPRMLRSSVLKRAQVLCDPLSPEPRIDRVRRLTPHKSSYYCPPKEEHALTTLKCKAT
jgi:hypothetical protein